MNETQRSGLADRTGQFRIVPPILEICFGIDVYCWTHGVTYRPLHRRTLVSAGALACLSGMRWTYGGLAASSTPGAAGFGRAKRCILLFMWGGPSHLDTFDPKPEAPAEVRGPFAAIPTQAPGIQICEHFRQVATVTDKLAIIRSLNHDDPAHLSSAHTILTGHLPPVNKSDNEPPSERDTPHLGAVMHRLGGAPAGLPAFVTLPWLAYHPAAPGGKAPGQHGGWLGRGYDPLLIDGDLNSPTWQVPALALQEGLSFDRVGRRQSLLAEIGAQQRHLEQLAETAAFGDQQRQAFGLLASSSIRKAFDLAAESEETRQRYGRNQHGQCVLLARRLAEHGVPFVSVNWHQDENPFWDTHGDNFNKLQNSLIPAADSALAALLTDLSERGMLEETIVAWVGEFGRAPKISANAGREHYPRCYSGVLAGGGIRGGQVYGASDATGSAPIAGAASPHEFTATLMHALGIAPEATLPDRSGRPHRLHGGRPIMELFA